MSHAHAYVIEHLTFKSCLENTLCHTQGDGSGLFFFFCYCCHPAFRCLLAGGFYSCMHIRPGLWHRYLSATEQAGSDSLLDSEDAWNGAVYEWIEQLKKWQLFAWLTHQFQHLEKHAIIKHTPGSSPGLPLILMQCQEGLRQRCRVLIKQRQASYSCDRLNIDFSVLPHVQLFSRRTNNALVLQKYYSYYYTFPGIIFQFLHFK